MNCRFSISHFSGPIIAIFAFLNLMLAAPAARAQDPQLQQRVAEIKQSMAMNKEELARYTWEEQQTISIKGEVKKQKEFQVQIGTDGKPQKTEIGAPDQSSDSGRKHGLKHRIVEEKKEEYEEYAQQIADLAQSYLHQDPAILQQLFQQGNVLLGAAGTPGEYQIVVHNYVKQGDSVTIIFSKPLRAVQSVQISSFLGDPSDAVNISAKFAKIPYGPNHAFDVVVNGVSKQLMVEMQNSNYQHL